jgi:3-oxoacyl-[acyl-carrier-protein] synthase-3
VFKIIATGKAVPPLRLSNADLAKSCSGIDDEWVVSHTGIKFRHVASQEVAASDLALEAARGAIGMLQEKSGKSSGELAAGLDVIIVSTITPDYNGFPSTACILQDSLGAKNAAALDLGAACTGFVYALETAAGLLMMDKGRKRALVVGAEVLSRLINWNDRNTSVLFGDGAGAVILEKTDNSPSQERSGLIKTILGSDGSGKNALLNRNGGSRHPFTAGETILIPPHIEMDGHSVYNFAVKAICKTIEGLLQAEKLSIDDISLIVPHQANLRIVQAAAKRLEVPEEKFFMNIAEYANTCAASIPIALDELNRLGKLQAGNIILTVGFGAGLTYGGNLIIW